MAERNDQQWPHDPDGPLGSEGKRSFDMAILSNMVGKDDFPIEREAFLEEHGTWPVRINHKTVVSVADIFEYVGPERFETKQAFHQAVGKALRKGDLWEYDVGE